LVPDPVKAPVVRRVFDLYTRKRLGTRTIAQQLRDEGAPAPSAGWGHAAVHWIISNPTYAGKIRWRDRVFDGIHTPLLDELTFAKAQAILAERGEHAKRRGNASDFLLSGLLRCGRCGKAYIGMSANGNGGRYHYYACTGRQKYGPEACTGERLPREKLEQGVLRQLATVYRNEQLVGDALATAQAAAEQRRPELEQRLASIGAEITRTEQAARALLRSLRAGQALSRTLRRTADARPGAPRRPPRPKKPNSRSKRHTRRDTRPQPPTSPPSPTNSTASSQTPSRRRRRHYCGCSSRNCASTVGRRSSPPTASSRPRFAQCPKKWAEPNIAQTRWCSTRRRSASAESAAVSGGFGTSISSSAIRAFPRTRRASLTVRARPPRRPYEQPGAR
jgi:hypothetical protein